MSCPSSTRRTAAVLTALLLATVTAGSALAAWTESSSGLPTSGEYFGVALADVDGDGDLDALAASDDDGLRVYLGDGAGRWSATSHIATEGGYGDLAVGDVDGDGHADVVATSPGERDRNPKGIHVHLGDGAGGFTDATAAAGLPDSGRWRGVALGDVDGDGDLDIAATSGYGDRQGIRVYAGDGGGGFASQSEGLPDGEDRDSKVLLADLDGDGDLDVAAGGRAGVDVFLGDGGAGGSMSWTRSSEGLPDDRFSGLSAADLDGDGDLDLVVSAYEAGSGDGVRAYLNEGGAASWRSASSGLPTSGDFIENAVGDVSGDGIPDIVTAGSYGGTYGVRAYTGDGNGGWTDASGGLPQERQYVGVDLGDVDGDGDLDILAGKRTGGGLDVYLNPGDGGDGGGDGVPDPSDGGGDGGGSDDGGGGDGGGDGAGDDGDGNDGDAGDLALYGAIGVVALLVVVELVRARD